MVKSAYEKHVLDTSVLAAEVTESSKGSCLGCLFWFIVAIVVLAILL